MDRFVVRAQVRRNFWYITYILHGNCLTRERERERERVLSIKKLCVNFNVKIMCLYLRDTLRFERYHQEKDTHQRT